MSMMWVGIGSAGASLASGIIGSRSSRRNQDAQNQANQAELAEQRRQFDLNYARQEPYHQAGVGATQELQGMRFRAPTAADVTNDAGYSFGLNEGREALENSAAARGGLFSGNTAKSLLKYGTDYGTTKFNDAFERQRSAFNTNSGNLFNLANIGTGAAAQLQGAGANYANNVGNIAQRGADAAGGASIARGNIWSDAINQGVSIGNRLNWGRGGGNVPTYAPSQYGDLGEQNFADGGPVLVEVAPGRYEPKVGTRSKRPGAGGGGAMGNENLVLALAAEGGASAPKAAPRYRTMRDMQVEKALKDAGAYADGGPVLQQVDPVRGEQLKAFLDMAVRNGGLDQLEGEIAKRKAFIERNRTLPVGGKPYGLPSQRGGGPNATSTMFGGAKDESAAYDAVMNLQESELEDLLERRRRMMKPDLSQYGENASPAYADGGPVMVPDGGGRMVPQIGMRTPRPGTGTGGGMSREEILQALTAVQAASAPASAPAGLADLKENPVTNPQGVTEQRLKDAGAYQDGGPVGGKKKAKCYAGGGGVRKDARGGGKVAGPGGPREDKVPAWLSNGEHVFDAAAVDGAGGGDNLRGQQVLNQVRAALRGG
jgi:hypothetical protein